MSSRFLLMSLLLSGCPYISVDELDERMDLDGDGVPRPEDCDDDDPTLGAPATWYADVDGDGWGTTSTTVSCTQPSGFAAQAGDCDDSEVAVSPDATELCNGIDDDCNGITDGAESADAIAWYQDGDGDGFGEASTVVFNCVAPGTGWVADGTDCDDEHDIAYPGNDEIWYDGIDGDCLGGDDYDQDGDGFQAEGWGADCDDTDDWINPDAEEACGDRIDNDCDGVEAACAFEGEQVYDQAPVVLLSAQVGDCAGWSWDSLGDVDGDGYDDLLIGAYDSDVTTSHTGAAYLVHGPLSGWHRLDQVGIRIYGTTSGGYLGYDVSRGGDLSGDGVADLLLTHPYTWSNGLGASATMLRIVPGPVDSELVVGEEDGYVYSPYGGDVGLFQTIGGGTDVSGDGSDDVVVAYYNDDAGAPKPGHIAAFAGPILEPRPLEDADGIITGENDADVIGYGWRLATGGDVSGDGIDDIAFGASSDADTNRAYVALGPVSGVWEAAELDVVLEGEEDGDELGAAIALPGDVDGDGVGDLVIGASGAGRSGGSYQRGAVYLMLGSLGSSSRIADAAAVIDGTEDYMGLGFRVAGAGDFNGDGRADLVVTGTSWDICPDINYIPFVFGTPLDGRLSTRDALAWACGRSSGWYQDGSAGDFNGDGWDDLLLSLRYSDVEDGAVSIWFGGVE